MKTTQKHFELFMKSAKKTIAMLGLTDWEINFYHEDLNGEHKAECTTKCKYRVARLSLNTKIHPENEKEFDPIKTGTHEVIHVLLADLVALAYMKDAEAWMIEEEEERIIRRLEKIL